MKNVRAIEDLRTNLLTRLGEEEGRKLTPSSMVLRHRARSVFKEILNELSEALSTEFRIPCQFAVQDESSRSSQDDHVKISLTLFQNVIEIFIPRALAFEFAGRVLGQGDSPMESPVDATIRTALGFAVVSFLSKNILRWKQRVYLRGIDVVPRIDMDAERCAIEVIAFTGIGESRITVAITAGLLERLEHYGRLNIPEERLRPTTPVTAFRLSLELGIPSVLTLLDLEQGATLPLEGAFLSSDSVTLPLRFQGAAIGGTLRFVSTL